MRFNFPLNLTVAKTAIARATLFQGDTVLDRAEAAASFRPRNGQRGGNFLYYIAAEIASRGRGPDRHCRDDRFRRRTRAPGPGPLATRRDA